jgi:epsin
MSSIMRSVKNVTKGYSSVQVKVREGIVTPRLDFFHGARETASLTTWHLPLATSNDSYGPTGTQMSEIAQLTYNAYVLP